MTDLAALVAQYTAAGGQIQVVPAGLQAGYSIRAYTPQDELRARKSAERACRSYNHDTQRAPRYLHTMRETRT